MIQLSPERQIELDKRLKKALQQDPLTPSQKDREGLAKNMDAINLLMNFRDNHYLSFVSALFVGFLIKQYATRALSCAAALGKTDLSAQLIDVYGADVNYRDEHKRTPLMRAMLRRRFGTAEMLGQRGGKAIRFKRGQTLLTLFCFGNVPSAIPVLKRLNFDLNKPIIEWNWRKNDFGWGLCPYYPVAIAAYTGHAEVLKALVENGARFDIPFGNRGSLHDVAAGKTSVKLKPAVVEILNDVFSRNADAQGAKKDMRASLENRKPNSTPDVQNALTPVVNKIVDAPQKIATAAVFPELPAPQHTRG